MDPFQDAITFEWMITAKIPSPTKLPYPLLSEGKEGKSNLNMMISKGPAFEAT